MMQPTENRYSDYATDALRASVVGRSCLTTDGFGPDCSSWRRFQEFDADAPRQTRSCGRGIRAGLSRSVARRVRSARASAPRLGDRGCPSRELGARRLTRTSHRGRGLGDAGLRHTEKPPSLARQSACVHAEEPPGHRAAETRWCGPRTDLSQLRPQRNCARTFSSLADRGRAVLIMYRPTVASLTSMPSISSSPWMRGAP